MRIELCLNCLESGASLVPVGPQKGPQIDPYRDEISLCSDCKTALFKGDFATLVARHATERVIKISHKPDSPPDNAGRDSDPENWHPGYLKPNV